MSCKIGDLHEDPLGHMVQHCTLQPYGLASAHPLARTCSQAFKLALQADLCRSLPDLVDSRPGVLADMTEALGLYHGLRFYHAIVVDCRWAKWMISAERRASVIGQLEELHHLQTIPDQAFIGAAVLAYFEESGTDWFSLGLLGKLLEMGLDKPSPHPAIDAEVYTRLTRTYIRGLIRARRNGPRAYELAIREKRRQLWKLPRRVLVPGGLARLLTKIGLVLGLCMLLLCPGWKAIFTTLAIVLLSLIPLC